MTLQEFQTWALARFIPRPRIKTICRPEPKPVVVACKICGADLPIEDCNRWRPGLPLKCAECGQDQTILGRRPILSP